MTRDARAQAPPPAARPPTTAPPRPPARHHHHQQISNRKNRAPEADKFRNAVVSSRLGFRPLAALTISGSKHKNYVNVERGVLGMLLAAAGGDPK